FRQARRLPAQVGRQHVDLMAGAGQLAREVGPAQRLRRRTGRKLVSDQQQAHASAHGSSPPWRAPTPAPWPASSVESWAFFFALALAFASALALACASLRARFLAS